jgi:hypothetical protein
VKLVIKLAKKIQYQQCLYMIPNNNDNNNYYCKLKKNNYYGTKKIKINYILKKNNK